MDCIRKLRKLEAEYQQQSENAHAITMAKSVREMLVSYSHRAKTHKVNELQHHFGEFFKRLARKNHAGLTPRIDPDIFNVDLVYSDGKTVDREQLSAGEKQIYATAMLAALGRTSGRRLPIIIDTPLGRLDSAHRLNIVESYFPYASHQVLLLSTDTEISLSSAPFVFKRAISKKYELHYSSNTESTAVKRGYF